MPNVDISSKKGASTFTYDISLGLAISLCIRKIGTDLFRKLKF